MKKIFLLLLITVSIAGRAQQVVQDFTLINVKNNKSVSLSTYSSAKAVVIIFTSHECPFDNYYKERMKELINSYSGKVQFLLINSNTEAQESAEQMSIHYTDFSVPYLADKDQVVMGMMGAKKTPEVFLLSSKSGKFSIEYTGAIDDNPQSAKDVRNYFLKNAIDNLLADSKPVQVTERVTGCTIRKK